ncbi:UvrD-helicase domain-containing protein [Cupriavidus basilensis]
MKTLERTSNRRSWWPTKLGTQSWAMTPNPTRIRCLRWTPHASSESAPVGMDRVARLQLAPAARSPDGPVRARVPASSCCCEAVACRARYVLFRNRQTIGRASSKSSHSNCSMHYCSLAAEPEVDDPRPEVPLNEKQRVAAGHRGKAFLLQAGPGTGKTRTLVARVEGLPRRRSRSKENPPPHLLQQGGGRDGRAYCPETAKRSCCVLWIGTFHGFGLDLLRRFNDVCGLPADPKLMDRTEAVELLEQEFPRLELVHYRDLYRPVPNCLSTSSRQSPARRTKSWTRTVTCS